MLKIQMRMRLLLFTGVSADQFGCMLLYKSGGNLIGLHLQIRQQVL